MKPVKLEPIESQEYNHYSDWLNESASDFLLGAPQSLTSIESAVQPLAWKIIREDIVVAIIVVSIDSLNQGKLSLVVDPRFRRQGVGSLAIAKLVKEPSIVRLRNLTGEVFPDNIGAQKILIKNGFARTGTTSEGNIEFINYLTK